MSQNISTNSQEREPLTAAPPIQPWSAEAEADKLMDELFSDIDQILEGGNRLPTEPAKPEYVSLKPIVIPQLRIPSPVVKPPQEELPTQPSTELAQSISTSTSEPLETEVAPKSSSSPKQSNWSFERLLLVVGFVFLGASLILLLVSKKKLTLPAQPWLPGLNLDPSPSVPKRQVSAADAEFSKYMERALKAIDAKSNARQQATIPPAGTNTTNPAQLPSQNRPLASSPPQRVIERVYIPVYPPQTPVAPSRPPAVVRPPVPTLSAPAPLPTLKPPVSSPTARRLVVSPATAAKRSAPSPAPAARRTAPSPAPAARRTAPSPAPVAKRTAPSPAPVAKRTAPSPAPVAKRTAPSPAPVAKRSAPASPQAAAPAALPTALPSLPSLPASVIIPDAPVTQSPTSTEKHTLVGVMEQGDRSAALFSMGGATRYIYVGEPIGASGWTLVSVANQEAVIRRNGEVRSVYAGQSF